LKTIFIQIAAYRDPELQATITDCLTKAKDQKNLKFCIAWQHCKEEKWDKLDQFVKDERFIILDIPFEESKGVCWARNKIQQFYNNETYSLQIDSHTRFVQDWDIELINMHELLLSKGHQKPVISTYAPFYNPQEEPRLFPPTAMALSASRKEVLCCLRNFIYTIEKLLHLFPLNFILLIFVLLQVGSAKRFLMILIIIFMEKKYQ
jgi:hypothetical protein